MMWLGIAFKVAGGRLVICCGPPVVLALCEFWASVPEVISGVFVVWRASSHFLSTRQSSAASARNPVQDMPSCMVAFLFSHLLLVCLKRPPQSMYCILSPKSLLFLSAVSSVRCGRPRLAVLWALEVQVTLEGSPMHSYCC